MALSLLIAVDGLASCAAFVGVVALQMFLFQSEVLLLKHKHQFVHFCHPLLCLQQMHKKTDLC